MFLPPAAPGKDLIGNADAGARGRCSFPRLRGKVAEGRKGAGVAFGEAPPFRLPAPSPATQGKDSIADAIANGGLACGSRFSRDPTRRHQRFGGVH